MNTICQAHVAHNTGWSGEMKKGQIIRITATTTVDFVFFKLQNLRERFDQARTKVYNMTLFVTAGHKLMGRDNQHMMTIIYDGNKTGTHDLQKGMCSGYRFRLAQQENRLAEYYPRAITEIPDHGCYENLSKDFNVFLVGDASLATFPANKSPKHAVNAAISLAAIVCAPSTPTKTQRVGKSDSAHDGGQPAADAVVGEAEP